MKDLLVYILKAIVDNPDEVSVEEVVDETGLITLNAKVAESDMGKVIGKNGKVINAIRQVVKIPAIKQGKRLNVSLGEPQGSDGKPQSSHEPELTDMPEENETTPDTSPEPAED